MLVYNARMTPQLSPTLDGTRRGTVRRWLLAGLGLLALALLGLYFRSQLQKSITPRPEPASFPITRLSDSPFLNTKPDASYVGSTSCRACHEEQHAPFPPHWHGAA